MKEFVEKLIERLEEEQEGYSDTTYYALGIGSAIKIVKDLASEHNNGWIPCSERLPSEGESWIFVNEFIVQAEGAELPTVAYFNGEYFCDREGHDCFLSEVIAWQPLPAPYEATKEEQQGSYSEIPNNSWKQQTMSRFERVE